LADSNVNLNVRTKGAKKAESSFKKIGKSLAGMAVAAVAAKKFFDTIERAGKIEGVANAFKKTGENLESLRQATRGTVSDFDLMQKAVQANVLGISGLEKLFKFASIRARETGQNVDYLVESIVTGLGRKSVLILDNLGINARRLADEAKRSGDFFKAFDKIISEDMAGMDEDIGKIADQSSRVSVAWENASDKLALFIGRLSTIEEGESQSIWQALLPTSILENFAKIMDRLVEDATPAVHGMTVDMHNGFRILVDDFENVGEVAAATPTKMQPFVDTVKELGLSIATLEIAGMEKESSIIDRMGFGERGQEQLVKTEKLAEDLIQTLGDTAFVVVQWDQLADMMSANFSRMFIEVYDNELVFLDNMLNAFKGMLEKMAAEMAAKAAIFGLFSAFGGGGLLAGGNFLKFISGGLFSHDGAGLSPRGGGGSTVNINMPNVSMINSKSIRQIKQSLSRYDRLH